MSRIETKLQQIESALQKGHLVNDRLQVVKKKGIQWVWIRFTQCLVKLFSCCTKQEPWSSYKAESVMKALRVYTQNNASPAMQERLQRIDNLLNNRIVTPAPIPTPTPTPITAPVVKEPVPLSPEDLKMEEALANFANDLCRELYFRDNASVSLSPLSIVAALGMFLHIINPPDKPLYLEKIGLKGVSEEKAHEIIVNTLKRLALPEDFKEGTFQIAQGIAYKNDIRPADSLIEHVKNSYSGEVIQSDNLQKEVNEWVAKKTHGKIPTFLKDNNTAVVLLNALYLDFQWKDKFYLPSKGWEVKEFTCLDGSKAPVSMMTQKSDVLLHTSEAFTMIEKAYISPEGRKLSQVIFLPKDPAKLTEMENQLTYDKLVDCRKSAQKQSIQLTMPKIKAESELNLLRILMRLGIPIDRFLIDMLGINDVEILHKTFVLNDENGSKAAAVTGVLFPECAIICDELHIDHAYAYFIMDGNTVLFRGRVSDGTPLVVDKA